MMGCETWRLQSSDWAAAVLTFISLDFLWFWMFVEEHEAFNDLPQAAGKCDFFLPSVCCSMIRTISWSQMFYQNQRETLTLDDWASPPSVCLSFTLMIGVSVPSVSTTHQAPTCLRRSRPAQWWRCREMKWLVSSGSSLRRSSSSPTWSWTCTGEDDSLNRKHWCRWNQPQWEWVSDSESMKFLQYWGYWDYWFTWFNTEFPWYWWDQVINRWWRAVRAFIVEMSRVQIQRCRHLTYRCSYR